MGVLAGSDGPTAIARWAVAKKDLLMQALDLPHGIPSRDVIRRVLSALKVDAFQSCFACWLNSLRDVAKEKAGISAELKDHVAIDGKTMKGIATIVRRDLVPCTWSVPGYQSSG